jgi:hypothetical protein
MKKSWAGMEWDDGEPETEAPSAATAEPSDDTALIEHAWQRMPEHWKKRIAPQRHARETAAMPATQAPSASPTSRSTSMPRPIVGTGPNPATPPTMDRDQAKRFAAAFRSDPQALDAYLTSCPHNATAVAQGYADLEAEQYAIEPIDRSESSRNPASETRSINPPVDISVNSVIVLAAACTRGDMKDAAQSAFARALRLGLSKDRNAALTVAEWGCGHPPQKGEWPSDEAAYHLAYVVATNIKSDTADLLEALKRALQWAVTTDRSIASDIATVLGGPRPSSIELRQESRYEVDNPWATGRRGPHVSPGL